MNLQLASIVFETHHLHMAIYSFKSRNEDYSAWPLFHKVYRTTVRATYQNMLALVQIESKLSSYMV